jgi:hypothetical protein
MVKNLPENQFAISKTSTVRDRLLEWSQQALARYGTACRWVVQVGDISNMYDELDPAGAIEALKQSIKQLPDWLGKRKVACQTVSMNRRRGAAKWGRATSDYKIEITMEELVAIATYDSTHTYYKYMGKINRRLFGVPMGGLLSAHEAVLTCSYSEQGTHAQRPTDLIGGVQRYMDDVLFIMAYSTDEEKAKVMAYKEVVCNGYPSPLELVMEPESTKTRFLELEISTEGNRLESRLVNKLVESILGGGEVIPRLPSYDSGTPIGVRQALVTGFIHRVLQGSSGPAQVLQALVEFRVELAYSGWPTGILLRTISWMVHSKVETMRKEDLMTLEWALQWVW